MSLDEGKEISFGSISLVRRENLGRLVGLFLFIYLIHLRGRGTEKKGACVYWFTPQMPTAAEAGGAEAKSSKPKLGLPHGWQGPMGFSRLLPSQAKQQEALSEALQHGTQVSQVVA